MTITKIILEVHLCNRNLLLNINIIITGIDATINGFNLIASTNLKFNNAWIPLRVPQPGHWYPVRTKKGHLGKCWISEGLKKYKKNNTQIAEIPSIK
jgi:hypothetical protein